MDYRRRDERAIDYGRSSLETGDTLVILHPEDYTPRDPSGFPLNKTVRVHSRRLIATDSKKFEKIFSPDVQRTARAYYYPDGFPKGIDFILDLRLVAPTNLEDSPFSEDISELLIAELRCSKGVRSWFTSGQRCGVSQNLVGGLDAVATSNISRPSSASMSASTETLTMNHFSSDPNPDRTLPGSNDANISHWPPPNNDGKTLGEIVAESNVTNNDMTFHADMLEALKVSALESGALYLPEAGQEQFARYAKIGERSFEDVLEYCPVRYRLGIEHLLQIIEGKEPKWLDSAPKIWTLYVVAKYFECTHYVTDRIFAWMLAPRNELFIEVLPEASLQMGFGLQNSIITRAAFAILASEEALRMSSCDSPTKTPKGVLDIHETRFIRAREPLDPFYTSMVEQAGERLYTKVKYTWKDLSDPKMSWLKTLPEWEKLTRLRESLAKVEHQKLFRDLEDKLDTLEYDLIQFVRGPIVKCFYESLPFTQIAIADNHRRLQQYNGVYCNSIKIIYDTLTNQERTMTRFFWQILSKLKIDENIWVNFADIPRTLNKLAANPFEGRDYWIAMEHGLQRMETYKLEEHVETFNSAARFFDIATSPLVTPNMKQEVVQSNDGPKSDLERFPPYISEQHAYNLPLRQANPNISPSAKQPEATVPREEFSLPEFFAQVRRHILSVCDSMLDKGELDWANTTDTLLCLSESDFDLLPTWEEREVVIEEPEVEGCELTDASDWDAAGDWDGADEGSMSDWDLVDG